MSKKCDYCNQKHAPKECEQEKKVADYIKRQVGLYMEKFVANNLKCPRCDHVLTLLGNHAPSLDIKCDNCKGKFEVKSKCLSVTNIPKDLTINHGNYFEYINRQKQGLDFIIIIYGVDRYTKIINIRKVIYISNEVIKEQRYIQIVKKENSPLSCIKIPDNTKLKEKILEWNYSYDFTASIKYILEHIV